MADGSQVKSMPAIVLPHWEEPQPPCLKPAPSLASVTGDTVQQIREALRAHSQGSAEQ